MIRRITSAALSILAGLCFFWLSAKAQTTYSMPSPFLCSAASRYPVTQFHQFSCRGIQMADSTGKIVGSFFFTAAYETVEVSLPGVPWPPNTYESYMTAPIPVSFTTPSGNNPSTFEFNWQDVDANGVLHTGTASGTWRDQVICGGSGCAWHAPKLLTFSTTVN